MPVWKCNFHLKIGIAWVINRRTANNKSTFIDNLFNNYLH